MAFKLSELLNPAPASRPSSPKLPARATPSHHRSPPSHTLQSPEATLATSIPHASDPHAVAVTTAYQAAASLTALATSGGASSHFPAYAYQHPHPPSHAHPYSHSPQAASHEELPPVGQYPSYNNTRRLSNIAPVEPLTALERTPTAPSPTTTLEQYHQKPSRSPDELRRQSISRLEAPILAPIVSAFDQAPPRQGTHAYGYDTSQIIPSPIKDSPAPNGAAHESNHLAHNREADCTRETPVTTQVREPSAPAVEPAMASPAPEPQPAMQQALTRSPPHIKDEPSGTPHEHTPAHAAAADDRQKSVANEDVDPETAKLIEQTKNEDWGLRGAKASKSVEDALPTRDPASSEPTSKKRPAPKHTAANKKGTAKKPPPKKRKVETEGGATAARSTTPSSRTSKTPAFNVSRTGKTSKSNTPGLGSSPAPSAHIASSDIEEGSGGDDDENEEYCICRKGDNHTWMIACDGGCDDWFHGKCVDIQEEDGALIDKYICPACEERGKGITTWLPMCRNDGCRQPARLKKGDASKYCSDECGREFMRTNVNRSAGATGGANSSSKSKNKRKANQTDNHDNSTGLDGAADSDEDMGPRGGALRPGEIKALITNVPDITQFRRLGEGVLTPPATTSPTAGTFPNSAKLTNGLTNGDVNGSSGYTFNDTEAARIAGIAREKDVLRMKRGLLKDKEKFVGMTREAVGRYAEREGIKPKDVCGYDKRLTWTEEQFDVWRQSKEGTAALEANSLDADEADAEADANGMDVDGDTEGEKGVDAVVGVKDFFCTRKRCERHRQWQKGALADVRFEESTLADMMRRLERDEQEVRQQALLRWRKSLNGPAGEEGTVEVVRSS